MSYPIHENDRERMELRKENERLRAQVEELTGKRDDRLAKAAEAGEAIADLHKQVIAARAEAIADLHKQVIAARAEAIADLHKQVIAARAQVEELTRERDGWQKAAELSERVAAVEVRTARAATEREAVERCAAHLDRKAAGDRDDKRAALLEESADELRSLLSPAPPAPDANCITTPDGGCIGTGCMHDVRDAEGELTGEGYIMAGTGRRAGRGE